MVLVFAIAIGIVVGLAFGGRIGRLADLQLPGMPLFGVAIALQVLAFPSSSFPWSVPDSVATVLWLGTYALLIAIVWLNRRVTGFPIAGAGMVSNLVAIVANGGHMPALPSALREAGVAFAGVYQNSVANGHPNLAWLVDRWAAPEWVLGANVYSVGDVLLGVGGVVIVTAAMGPRLPGRRAPVRAEPADGTGD
jgi:hypothetical protein